jgi:hypothetical protein
LWGVVGGEMAMETEYFRSTDWRRRGVEFTRQAREFTGITSMGCTRGLVLHSSNSCLKLNCHSHRSVLTAGRLFSSSKVIYLYSESTNSGCSGPVNKISRAVSGL